MKIKLLGSGNDGHEHYEAGTTYEEDNEWARRLLVSGMAEPMDKEARELVESEDMQSRYFSKEIHAAAQELKGEEPHSRRAAKRGK
jgi:hypothetical protein